jgi:hypothetical protein
MGNLKWIEVKKSEKENNFKPLAQIVAQIYGLDLDRHDHREICLGLLKSLKN